MTQRPGPRRPLPGTRRPRAALLALAGVLTLTTACSSVVGSVAPISSASAGSVAVPSAADPAPTAGSTGPATPQPAGDPTALAAAADAGLRGKVVVIDPGHNGGNGRHARQIARKVWIGNGRKACDTTGTQTNAGYSESAFNLDVATRLAALLRARGATVILTRTDNRGVGPCITERAAVGNRAHADVAISIHADGAPSSGYGFHVIVPRGIGRNDAIVAPSRRLGVNVRDAFRQGTGEALSTYTGTRSGGLVQRSDLGGLNLSDVPKVFIECGNMRNAADARRFGDPAWRQRAATALAAGLTTYLTGR